MKKISNEFELYFEIPFYDEMLYKSNYELQLDIYYNETGHPAKIHDLYGSQGLNNFRIALVNEICKINNTDNIWRVSHDAYAILSAKSNCGCFKIKYKDIIQNISKRTVLIKSLDNEE